MLYFIKVDAFCFLGGVPVEGTIVHIKIWRFQIFAFNSAASETDIGTELTEI